MQAGNLQAGADDLAKKLVSLDSLDNHAAVNQYFDTHAVWKSDYFYLCGASHIKAQFDLVNWLFAQSNLLLSSYDSVTQTITIRTDRTPYLARLPFADFFLPIDGKLQFEAVVHLNPDGDSTKDDEEEILVTKVEVARVNPTALEKLFPWFVIRSVLGILVSFLAFVTALSNAPPSSPRGLVGFAINIVVYSAVYLFHVAKHLSAIVLPSTADGAHDLVLVGNVPQATDKIANAVEKIQDDDRKQASGAPSAVSSSTQTSSSPFTSATENRGRHRSANGSESLGGANSTAANAPSFAQVAAEHPHESRP